MSIALLILQSLLTLLFILTGFSKLAGAKQQVEAFNHLKLPQWFRVVTGIVQLIGVAGLIVGFWYADFAAMAGLWLGITMLCAAIAHFRVKDSFSKAVPALILMVIAFAVTFIIGV
ncbi:DoxX family protein [Cytobacillus firmus]|uniref:DoxX family protein n=1 Tax=Cytobacillus firmus TaxID=1399 RepID=UPI00222832C9|nr:DoxX family protein [Cytobacillus firmus]